MNYLPKSRLGLSVLAGSVAVIVFGLGAMFAERLIAEHLWEASIAAGVSVFVAVYVIDLLSEWVQRRPQG